MASVFTGLTSSFIVPGTSLVLELCKCVRCCCERPADLARRNLRGPEVPGSFACGIPGAGASQWRPTDRRIPAVSRREPGHLVPNPIDLPRDLVHSHLVVDG